MTGVEVDEAVARAVLKPWRYWYDPGGENCPNEGTDPP
jgi:hypothetical protein